MTETKIYVGLNDSETLEQRYETEKYADILKNVCLNYHAPFSFVIQQGGYFHEDGRYTEENTIVISLLDAENATVNEIAKDLCLFFRQESVLITECDVRSYFVNEAL